MSITRNIIPPINGDASLGDFKESRPGAVAVSSTTRSRTSRGKEPGSEPPSRVDTESGDKPNLAISREKVCHIVFKVREFDVKDLPTFLDDGSDPPDEEMRSVLDDRPEHPVRQELAAFISAMSFDEQVDRHADVDRPRRRVERWLDELAQGDQVACPG
jgi:hypothetical protein